MLWRCNSAEVVDEISYADEAFQAKSNAGSIGQHQRCKIQQSQRELYGCDDDAGRIVLEMSAAFS